MSLQELALVPLSDRRWRLDRDFIVITKVAGLILVPKGFICDLNSMPRFLWWASTPTDYPEAGVVHDWLYHVQAPRAAADAVYRELLLTLGMSSARAQSRYLALRSFGWAAYRKHAGPHTHGDSN